VFDGPFLNEKQWGYKTNKFIFNKLL
jgi:hypothetical protein